MLFHHPTPHSHQKHTAERNEDQVLNPLMYVFPTFWTLTRTSICVWRCIYSWVCVPAFSGVPVSVLEVWCSVLLSGHWAAKWPEPEWHWNRVACKSVLTAGSQLPTHRQLQTKQSTVISLNHYTDQHFVISCFIRAFDIKITISSQNRRWKTNIVKTIAI